MIQLKILSGRTAGAGWVARRFPVRIGRARNADLQLEEGGVWDQHLELEFKPREGITLTTQSEALASVNGKVVHQTLLRNGDTIELGCVKLQFWLSDTRQAATRLREGATWVGIALICLLQVFLAYWLGA
jgi:Inner membrane component of T3SS, cytoplasmic domain